jgi:hypothetical protein
MKEKSGAIHNQALRILETVGINYVRTRKNHTCYGMGIGIMVLDDVYPGFPRDVRNASAFTYPVQYEIAEGVDNHTLV